MCTQRAPERIVIVAAGTGEPLATGAYTLPQRHENDRVEILEVNRRVDELSPTPADEGLPG